MFPFIVSLISIVVVFSFIAYLREQNRPQALKVRIPSRDQQFLSSRNRR
jgi:uncharacterized membrane protein